MNLRPVRLLEFMNHSSALKEVKMCSLVFEFGSFKIVLNNVVNTRNHLRLFLPFVLYILTSALVLPTPNNRRNIHFLMENVKRSKKIENEAKNVFLGLVHVFLGKTCFPRKNMFSNSKKC